METCRYSTAIHRRGWCSSLGAAVNGWNANGLLQGIASHIARAQIWALGSAPMLKRSKTVGIPLLELREGQCRWPVDDKQPPRRFCADPTVGLTSWCEVHAQRAFGALREARSARRTG
jgi:hypothetical protein